MDQVACDARPCCGVSAMERLAKIVALLEDKASSIESRFNPVLRPQEQTTATPGSRGPETIKPALPPMFDGMSDSMDHLDAVADKLQRVLMRCEV